MKPNCIKNILSMLVFGAIVFAACSSANTDMPNPASQFCEENGGTIDIRNGTDGQHGVCVFPDGSECDEWEFARGNCKTAPETDDQAGIANPASVFCEEQGGTLELREDENGMIGYCIFNDGSECEEWAYFRAECTPGGAKMIPPTEPQGNFITGGMFINQVEISIAESYPVQVSLHLTGELPTPCDQLQAVITPPDTENKIFVELNSWQEKKEVDCVQVITPFISHIDIPTLDLPEGTYSVWLDGKLVGEFSYPG